MYFLTCKLWGGYNRTFLSVRCFKFWRQSRRAKVDKVDVYHRVLWLVYFNHSSTITLEPKQTSPSTEPHVLRAPLSTLASYYGCLLRLSTSAQSRQPEQKTAKVHGASCTLAPSSTSAAMAEVDVYFGTGVCRGR